MKKAFLVSFSPMTRVIVDVEERNTEDNIDFRDGFETAKIVTAARKRMIEIGIEEYLNGDNLDEITEDEEMPYNEEEEG